MNMDKNTSIEMRAVQLALAKEFGIDTIKGALDRYVEDQKAKDALQEKINLLEAPPITRRQFIKAFIELFPIRAKKRKKLLISFVEDKYIQRSTLMKKLDQKTYTASKSLFRDTLKEINSNHKVKGVFVIKSNKNKKSPAYHLQINSHLLGFKVQ